MSELLNESIQFENLMPLITVIIPVYKVEEYLNICVDSIIYQSYLNLEILLVDDGSPDNCPKICDEYERKDKRIHVIHKVNGGLSDARNFGIKAATGDYIIFLDSDDKLANKDVIKNLVDFIVKEKPTITFCNQVRRFSKDSENPVFEKTINDETKYTSNELFNLASKKHYLFAAWLFVVSRHFLIENNLFFKKGLLHEDMEWIPRVLCADNENKISLYTGPFYLYRYNPSSITGSFTQKRFDSLEYILLNLFKSCPVKSNKQFLKKWFNMNLYNLFIYFENECLNNTELYKMNIELLKNIYNKNCGKLNIRNRIIQMIININPIIIFKLRKTLKGKKI